MKNKKDLGFVILGVFLIIAGIGFLKTNYINNTMYKTLPYILVGIGCGLFGHSVGKLIQKNIIKTEPQIAKQLEIEKNDERNISISHRAKSKAYNSFIYIFSFVLIYLSLSSTNTIMIIVLLFHILA